VAVGDNRRRDLFEREAAPHGLTAQEAMGGGLVASSGRPDRFHRAFFAQVLHEVATVTPKRAVALAVENRIPRRTASM
jgi:hypothetical protein